MSPGVTFISMQYIINMNKTINNVGEKLSVCPSNSTATTTGTGMYTGIAPPLSGASRLPPILSIITAYYQ